MWEGEADSNVGSSLIISVTFTTCLQKPLRLYLKEKKIEENVGLGIGNFFNSIRK